ncbi:3075_t:CDS:2, partial [Gigaspora rosea]
KLTTNQTGLISYRCFARKRINFFKLTMDYEKTVAKTRQILKDRLTDRSVPDELVGLDEQYTELLNYMNRTVSLGESNTCILIGPSGCGKTA